MPLAKFGKQRLRGLLDEFVHLAGMAGPGVLHRQVPAEKFPHLRLVDLLGASRFDEVVFLPQRGIGDGPQFPQDYLGKARENLGDTDQPGRECAWIGLFVWGFIREHGTLQEPWQTASNVRREGMQLLPGLSTPDFSEIMGQPEFAGRRPPK
ncbi:MAG: hypothetical protein R3F31_08155 [Verrucomicrobiales bacterium]